MKNEIHPLKKINWGVIPIENYRGVLVTKIIGGYTVLGKKAKTEEAVDEIIDKASETLLQSIKKIAP